MTKNYSENKEEFTMVRFNSKRLLAVIVATTTVLGSSLTAFAASPLTQDGAGTYEGNIPTYPAASVTFPTTIASGSFKYVADPNGLIQKTSSAAHSGATWEGDGIYFETAANTYKGTSKAIEVENNSAYSVDLAITLEQKTAGKNVAYSDDKTFANSSKEEIYLALSDGTNTAAITQTANGNAVTVNKAELNVTVAGKPSNYELGWDASNKYKITAKTGATGWNKSSVVVTGALNKNAAWAGGSGDDEIAFPEVTVTYAYSMGAAPVFIKNGIPQDVTLSHDGASVTIKQIDFKGTVVPSSMYEATTIASGTPATLTLKSGFTSYAYPKTPADGLVFTVTYSDDFQETFTCVKW